MSDMKRGLIDMEDDLPDVAAGWFALQRSGQMAAEDAEEFTRWLAGDPAHAAAMLKVDATWRSVEAARAHPDILALREQATGRKVARGRFWSRPATIAASIACALVLGGGVVGVASSGPGLRLMFGPIEQDFRTSVGQRTTMTLPDGSVVTLDTDTAMRTIESRTERRVVLRKGQAFFRVAKDPGRPFVVVAGDRKVTALGTAFGVRVDKDRFELTMVEGVVKVEAPMSVSPGWEPKVQEARMAAGSQLVAVQNSQWTIRPVDSTKETGWVRGLLTYESTPLQDVAEELNRYSDRKIVIRDPDLAQRRVNGTFRANDLEGAITALEAYGLVRVTTETDSTVELATR